MKLHEYLAALHDDAVNIDLSLPDFSLGPLPSDDDSKHDDDETSDRDQLVQRPTSTSGARREHHNKHTRRCRKRQKGKFDALLATLPTPADTREVKHKVQVLDYAMDAFRALDDELRALEWALALRSHAHLLRWTAASGGNTEPFVELFLARMGFVYAETWRRSNDSTWFVERAVAHPTPWCGNPHTATIAAMGERLVRTQQVISETYPPLAQALECMQPVQHQGDTSRAELGAATILCVPIQVGGEVNRIVAFFDVRDRIVEVETCRLAAVIAASIGNVACANEHERAVQNNTIVSGGRGASSRGAKT